MPGTGFAKETRAKRRKITRHTQPTGNERTFGRDEVIVSKTDAKGVITYANRTFMKVAGFEEDELLGAPHSIIRHPDMPRCVFKLLWDTLAAGREIFAYVVNMAKNGDHYWVFAHVTPSIGLSGDLLGYHSNPSRPGPDGHRRDHRTALPIASSRRTQASGPQDGARSLASDAA